MVRNNRRYSRKNKEQLKIAESHVLKYFEMARKVSLFDLGLADRYVDLARKVAMKFKIRVGSVNKRLYCQHCYKFILPGVSGRVRVSDGKIIYYCNSCKKFWRKPLNKPRK